MRDRAEEFWTGSFVTAFILSDEDMFLLKAVSGGDQRVAVDATSKICGNTPSVGWTMS